MIRWLWARGRWQAESTTTRADLITALRVALGAGRHADAPTPSELEPYGPDDQFPDGAAEALEARAPELAERARRLGLARSPGVCTGTS